MAATRVGFWYATGPVDKDYKVGDPVFSLHTVISDKSEYFMHYDETFGLARAR